MTKELIGKEIIEGAFVIDESGYSNLRFRSALALPLEYADKHRAIQSHYKEIENLEREIVEYVRKDFKVANMPSGMSCTKVEVKKDGVYAEWDNEKISVFRITRNNPNPPAPPASRCPYLDLANRSDFKQILSSGILSKEERRKCLGLPPLPEATA